MEKRSHTLQVRFSPDELTILDSVATEWQTTRADAIRRMAREQKKRNAIEQAKLRRLTEEPAETAD